METMKQLEVACRENKNLVNEIKGLWDHLEDGGSSIHRLDTRKEEKG